MNPLLKMVNGKKMTYAICLEKLPIGENWNGQVIIDCVSDLHGAYPQLEGGDLLIVAGDLTARDRINEYITFMDWICVQEYHKIIVIGGNHDMAIEFEPEIFTRIMNQIHGNFTYLCDEGVSWKGLRIWGSPWTKTFSMMNPDCMALTVDTDKQLAEKWALIPDDTDILITHCPPYGIMDGVQRNWVGLKQIEYCGSASLLKRALEIRPKLHVFGHIHEFGGQSIKMGQTTFVNASIMNREYQPVNKPIRIEI